MNAAKEEYFSKLVKAINYGNFDAYKKIFLQNPEFKDRLPLKERQQLGLNLYDQKSSCLSHMHFVAFYVQDVVFLKKVIEYRTYLGLSLYGAADIESEKTPSILNFLLLNKQKFLFLKHNLEELFKLDELFVRHESNCFWHKLSFLAELRHENKINLELYNYFFEVVYDENFKKTFPIYSSFTKEEIKQMNLSATVVDDSMKPSAQWLDCKNLEALAIKFTNRKSKQVKKSLIKYCFSNLDKKTAHDFLNTLWFIKDHDDQVFYWALNLYPNLPDNFSEQDLITVLINFSFFQQESALMVTLKRIEKLFELNGRKNTIPRDSGLDFRLVYDVYESSPRDIYSGHFEQMTERNGEVVGRNAEVRGNEVVHDLIRMMNLAKAANLSYDIKDFNTAMEFHDFLVAGLRSAKTQNLALNQNEILALDKITFDKFKIIVPKMTKDLMFAGQMLNICVGTAAYDVKVVNKQCNVVFLTLDKQVVGCVEFYNGEVIQMKGKHNKDFSSDLVKKFKTLLQEMYEKKQIEFIEDIESRDNLDWIF